MKKLLLAVLFLPSVAAATPYFRLIGTDNYHVNAGAWVNPANGTTDCGSAIALITHSTRDGALLKSIQADWTLLQIGGGYGNGNGFMSLGSSANMVPATKALLLRAIEAATKEESWPGIKQALAPATGEDKGGLIPTASYGPQWYMKPLDNGQLRSLKAAWRSSEFRLFVGAAWNF